MLVISVRILHMENYILCIFTVPGIWIIISRIDKTENGILIFQLFNIYI